MPMMHRSRGQANIETALYLPLMVFVMFALWWAAREAVIHGRAYDTLRYGAQVTALTNPSKAFSLQTLYSTVHNSSYSPSGGSCTTFETSLLQGTATSAHATTHRGSFFSPASSSASCVTTPLVMVNGFSRNLLMNAMNGTVTANVGAASISTQLSFLTPLDTIKISQTFFTPPDLPALTHCYAGVESALYASLYEGAKGTGASTPQWDTSSTYNAPLPPTSPITVSGGCGTTDPPGYSPSAPSSIPAAPAPNGPGVSGLGTGTNPTAGGGGSADNGVGFGHTRQ
jgi:hypothetical protein